MLEQILYFESEIFGGQRSELLTKNGFPNIWIKRLVNKRTPVFKITNGEGHFDKVNIKNHSIAFVSAKYLEFVPRLVHYGFTVIGTDSDGSNNDLRVQFISQGAADMLERTRFEWFVQHDLLKLYLKAMAQRSSLLVIESDLDQGEFLTETLQTKHFQTLWLQYIERIDAENKVLYGYDGAENKRMVELKDYTLAVVGSHTGSSSGTDFIRFLKELGLYSVGIFKSTIECMDVQKAGSIHAVKPVDFSTFVDEDLPAFSESEIRRIFESQPIFSK